MMSLKKIILTEGSIGDKVKKDFELLKSIVEKLIEFSDISNSKEKENEIKTWELINAIYVVDYIKKHNINLSDNLYFLLLK